MTGAIIMPEGTGFFISWRAEPTDPDESPGGPSPRWDTSRHFGEVEGDVELHFNSVDEFKQFVKDQPVKGQVCKVGPFLEDPRVHGLGDANSVAYCAIWNPYASEAECEQMVVFNKKCSEQASKVLRQRQAKVDAGEGRGYNP